MKKYDCIIIGTGPASAGAAKILKDNNINFCVIEKAKLPREKLCGGGLTNKSVKTLKKLGLTYDNINTKHSSYVTLVSKSKTKKVKLENDIVMIDRKEFDYNNIKNLTNKNLFTEERIIDVNDNTLITDKDKYDFKYLIFADGVNGYSRKLIKNREFGFCVEYKSDKVYDETIIDFMAIKDGYGWIFPKKDHTTIGLGNLSKEKADYIKALIDFGDKYDIKVDKSKIKGYHIPVYKKDIYKNSVIDNKYILVGDAASLVDNASGEGIYYALASGMYAAESIVECLKDKNKDLKEIYLDKSNGLYKSLNKRKSLSKLLYSKRINFYIKLGLSNKKLTKKIMKIFG